MSEARKLFIKTYGCQMNVYDSERMAEALGAKGYVLTEVAEEADMVLLNTCHIREKAAEKVYSDLGRLRPLKTAKPDLKIGVAGCVAQAEGEEILKRMPLVDLVVGPQSYHRLPDMLERTEGGARVVDTDFPEEDKFDHLPERKATRGPAAFLTVQEGCDKFCAFCVVPYTRGAEVSRPFARLMAEARGLVERGVREITLLGQNVNAWSNDGRGLGGLIRELARIDGLERLRYTTSHPNDMADDLIEAHGAEPKLMPYLHLPVQSGSDRILKAMNRKHTAEHYLRLIERIRAARPDILLTSDFIVGFPGETEADFEATLDLIRAVGFGSAFSFKYSARPGTPAAEKPELPAEVCDARLQRLQALVTEQQRAAQMAMVGREVGVLYEKAGRLPGQMVGKSDHLHAVHVEDKAGQVGDLVRVRITASAPNSLAGERLGA
ncbi:tRNA (N6-isopentenyl adenosine(37)-C2)-methylthiotransferase MiaB [Rhodobacter sphaeroides]|jgi:tRNA-2-methylthio-N6-dimethylallyladenosine synthase|uniref:tRNA-2-methylthio-N(6)-dimethylallyladenosine synthase n=1 Tax=Cereibacter sphaeroides (strain ATCC 17023 / DSM 158 / JCM 6121 / CCUG 31486 / LMG 2827 / NBRC 12203 / NCIMB 8253 / ATH 2.4.1.) TaxID=272943 RepID=MIAB_CERS4|nr:tRNA (N6-isopentenyl adenosine(37)-C2)-methylthiotransferase MiaB [Cereibacter sphaeroides]Q3IW81.1 RecName: Full=tRNA-2-methylthio-N(6)-dimethylallyladenosine synthase; AltName: Full=(Dimethylallyl)adenosine tRNA methylthiotransferase MiaB; AltName: Full=tRNA-i(6)A37 methylthiotransferase [Cereibacter sphaeroides 2.4.1]ABA81203.1 tRNA-i(6)A37 thiotransferase enzyme MiaB [Cereibacter sphaeroides 2.4.1]AMJ49508.1 (dimethylallyl)adenosine tRNA methylthiotransferase [Cereibacter sphaeroides]ANS